MSEAEVETEELRIADRVRDVVTEHYIETGESIDILDIAEKMGVEPRSINDAMRQGPGPDLEYYIGGGLNLFEPSTKHLRQVIIALRNSQA